MSRQSTTAHTTRTARHQRAAPFTEQLPSPVFFRAEELPADAAYPLHCHVWGEFVYAYSGVMEVKAGEQHYLIPPQYGLWLPPNIRHIGMNRLAAWHCSVYIDATLTEALPSMVCALGVTPLLKALLDDLRERPPSHTPPNETAQRRLLLVRDELCNAPRISSYLPTSDDHLLQPILHTLDSAPADARTLADWAAAVHTTERTLMRRFQNELGMGFLEWRQRLRVIKAMPLLENGIKVETLSRDLGYTSTSAFIAMFRRLTGVTPDEHRRSVNALPKTGNRPTPPLRSSKFPGQPSLDKPVRP